MCTVWCQNTDCFWPNWALQLLHTEGGGSTNLQIILSASADISNIIMGGFKYIVRRSYSEAFEKAINSIIHTILHEIPLYYYSSPHSNLCRQLHCKFP